MKKAIALVGCLAAGSLVSAAADIDRCTFDFHAVSRKIYESEGGGGNLVSNSNFREKEDPKAATSWRILNPYVPCPKLPKEQVAETQKKIVSMIEMSLDDGMASVLVPAEACDLRGGDDDPAGLQTYIVRLVMLPHATGGIYRISMQYRSNHTRGRESYHAYVFAQPVHVDDATGKGRRDIGKRLGNHVRDTGEDADYTRLWAHDVKVPEGANAVELMVRFMGAGYLKFTNFRMEPAAAEKPRAPVEFLLQDYGFTDNRFAIESGEVGNLQVNWRRTKAAKLGGKGWVEVDVPKGFAFVGANLADPRRKAERLPREDGGERVRLPLAGKFEPWDRELFYGACALYLEIRATGPAGTEGTLAYRVIDADGVALKDEGSCTLTTVEPFAARTPKRYRLGAMMTYPQMLLRTGEGANEAFAEYVRSKGVTWLMPDTSWILEDKTLIPMWREKGFDLVTSTDHDRLMNAYHIMGSCPRPPEENYVKRPDIPDNWGIVKGRATCPAAIYEERPFFVTNVVPGLAARNAGADGLWINWEPHAYHGCCNCAHCKKLFAEWTAQTGGTSIDRFHSWQQGQLVKTVHKWIKKSFNRRIPGANCQLPTANSDAVGLMPASSWSALCTKAYETGYPAEYLSSEFADSVDWMPAWGPYVGWSPLEQGYYGGPYGILRGATIVVFFAAKDVRENMDRLYKVEKKGGGGEGGRCPKLMGQPAGPNWLIQPEWLEIAGDAYFFNRWEAYAPWIFPHGADARHWKAYANCANRAARYEDAVWDGVRNDAATTLAAKPGFDVRINGFEKAYFPNEVNVPLVQQTTYDYKGARHVAVFNFDDESHAELTLKTAGLPAGNYTVVREDGVKPLGDRAVSAETLAAGVDVSVPVSACRVFEIRPAVK